MKIKSIILVLIQFTVFSLILFTGKFIPENYFILGIDVIALFIGVVAVYEMNIKNLSVFPEIKQGAVLRTKGIYSLIRHPMYTSLLLLAVGFVMNDFSFIRLTLLIILLINQLIKLSFEEQLLKEKFVDYSEYMKKTKRIIPFIF